MYFALSGIFDFLYISYNDIFEYKDSSIFVYTTTFSSRVIFIAFVNLLLSDLISKSIFPYLNIIYAKNNLAFKHLRWQKVFHLM